MQRAWGLRNSCKLHRSVENENGFSGYIFPRSGGVYLAVSGTAPDAKQPRHSVDQDGFVNHTEIVTV